MAKTATRKEYNQQKEKWNKLLLTYEYWRDDDQIARNQWKTGDDKTGFDDYLPATTPDNITREEYRQLTAWRHFIRNNILKGKSEWTNPTDLADTAQLP